MHFIIHLLSIYLMPSTVQGTTTATYRGESNIYSGTEIADHSQVDIVTQTGAKFIRTFEEEESKVITCFHPFNSQ